MVVSLSLPLSWLEVSWAAEEEEFEPKTGSRPRREKSPGGKWQERSSFCSRPRERALMKEFQKG